MQPILMQPEHVAGVVALQELCFPPPFPAELLWKTEHIDRHLQQFPEGQLVISDRRNLVLASATSIIISEENWQTHSDWETTVGGHFLKNHCRGGTTLYAVDLSVHPDWRSRGFARALYEARYEVARKLNLFRVGTSCRMPDFSASGIATPELYAKQVEHGVFVDRTLTPLLRCGMSLVSVARDNMEDPESGNAAAVLERIC